MSRLNGNGKEEMADAVEFSKMLLDKKVKDAEGFMVSIHILKDEKINHHFQYHAWPNGDWGNAMIAMAIESRKAELNSTAKDRET